MTSLPVISGFPSEDRSDDGDCSDNTPLLSRSTGSYGSAWSEKRESGLKTLVSPIIGDHEIERSYSLRSSLDRLRVEAAGTLGVREQGLLTASDDDSDWFKIDNVHRRETHLTTLAH